VGYHKENTLPSIPKEKKKKKIQNDVYIIYNIMFTIVGEMS
jgi:hypothetical protein